MCIKTGRCPKCGVRVYQRGGDLYVCDCQITKPGGGLMTPYNPVVDSLAYGSRALNAIRNSADEDQRDWRIHFWDGATKSRSARPVEVKLR